MITNVQHGTRITEGLPVAVYRADDSETWRSSRKRAYLDVICPDCRAITDETACATHEGAQDA